MDKFRKKCSSKYDRVMPRVHNQSRASLKSVSYVTRHEIPPSHSLRTGGKPSVSNATSDAFGELPLVLNDYVTSPVLEKVPKSSCVVKPKKTLKSLDPSLSPLKNLSKSSNFSEKPLCVTSQGSAPSVLLRDKDQCSNVNSRQCLSSRSHTRLKEIKDEIKAFEETDKLMKLKSKLYKSCGIMLDDIGQVSQEKRVQVGPDSDNEDHLKRAQQWNNGEDAGTTMFNQQMRSVETHYPVDPYLVESSKKNEMVNIIGDEIWNSEPALRPEDEIMLRKLHEMLQSTADDLKLLSTELTKFHTPGVLMKSSPTPLDEEFNEKVYIEEIVNAKFHGYKIIDKSTTAIKQSKLSGEFIDGIKPKETNLHNTKVLNTDIHPSVKPLFKKPVTIKNLGISRTKIIHVSENKDVNNHKVSTDINKNTPQVSYNEVSYKYVKPLTENFPQKYLHIQEMPRVIIRSELKKQNVLQLDILPDDSNSKEKFGNINNVAVLALQHETVSVKKLPSNQTLQEHVQFEANIKPHFRKCSKMSTCESSESNDLSSDTHYRLKTQKQLATTIKSSPKNVTKLERLKNKKPLKKDTDKRPRFSLDEWKKKINTVYDKPTTIKKNKKVKRNSVKLNTLHISKVTDATKRLNNADYVPYSQLTLGGFRVSDIERELASLQSNNKDIPLSPILDKIQTSTDNSFQQDNSKNYQCKSNKNILTTSDENLLLEVLDIEKTVGETLSKKDSKVTDFNLGISSNSDEKNHVNESYVDDFEDEKSESSMHSKEECLTGKSIHSKTMESSYESGSATSNNKNEAAAMNANKNAQNSTYKKSPNLSFKNSIDIFEFVHSVDTQDTATQSNISDKLFLKETQTSPRNDKQNLQPIHNDLWPTIDPRGKLEKMFVKEKEVIKKIIIEEYGDLLENSYVKPFTSKDKQVDRNSEKNMAMSQKVTQTSPARVKSITTSPLRTKTRPTSPFALPLTIDHQTSPITCLNREEKLKDEIGNEAEDLGIVINLSSPRFNLHLPESSREILSNLEICNHSLSKMERRENNMVKSPAITSSSMDYNNSSSEISSLGEVNLKFKKKLKNRVLTISESSSSSTVSKYSSDIFSGSVLPLKSEGEVSFGQGPQKNNNKNSKSEGEMSYPQ